MDIKVIANDAGIFARVMLIVQTIRYYCAGNGINIDDINSIYFESNNNGNNLFDYVIEQVELPNYDVVLPVILHKHYTRLTEDEDLHFFKKIFNKIKFKDTVLNMLNNEIDRDTLGVHVRLTDMNTLHGDSYGVRSFETYLNGLVSATDNKVFKNIFISSDNIESINKLKEKYDIIFNSGISNRHDSESDEGYYDYQIENLMSEKLWVDSFLDMLSLSMCGEMVMGVSSLSNVSIIISKTLNKIHYV